MSEPRPTWPPPFEPDGRDDELDGADFLLDVRPACVALAGWYLRDWGAERGYTMEHALPAALKAMECLVDGIRANPEWLFREQSQLGYRARQTFYEALPEMGEEGEL